MKECLATISNLIVIRTNCVDIGKGERVTRTRTLLEFYRNDNVCRKLVTHSKFNNPVAKSTLRPLPLESFATQISQMCRILSSYTLTFSFSFASFFPSVIFDACQAKPCASSLCESGFLSHYFSSIGEKKY